MTILLSLLRLDEHSSANPFVFLVSAVEMRINQVRGSGELNKLTISSLDSQLDQFLKLLSSAKNWIIPEPDLKKKFHEALPDVISKVQASKKSVNSGSITNAVDNLKAAREILVKKSGLPFPKLLESK